MRAMKIPKLGQTPSPSLVELAESVRKLSSEMLRVEGDHLGIDQARRTLDDVAALLSSISSRADVPRVFSDGDPSITRPYYFPGALAPRVHVAAPWMTAQQEETRRFGQVRFELIHEGPPSCVHGGFVAWMFDQAFGQHVVSRELGGPTHKLEVTYRRPSPILTELDYEVVTERHEGRKLFVSGTLRNGETLVAEASALFVQPKGTF
jgi:acyl-coenzyme A thioesterase PaaI-like protein